MFVSLLFLISPLTATADELSDDIEEDSIELSEEETVLEDGLFSGDGTEENPWLIGTYDELQALDTLISGAQSNIYVRLSADIQANSSATATDNVWTPLEGSPYLHLDGNDHIISNLYITMDEVPDPNAEFALTFIKKAYTIKKITMENTRVICPDFESKAEGDGWNDPDGWNCRMSAIVDSADTLYKCNLTGETVFSSPYYYTVESYGSKFYYPHASVGGIAYQARELNECMVSGSVRASFLKSYGGLVHNGAKIDKCYTSATNKIKANYVAGILFDYYDKMGTYDIEIRNSHLGEGVPYLIQNTDWFAGIAFLYEHMNTGDEDFEYFVDSLQDSVIENCSNYAYVTAEYENNSNSGKPGKYYSGIAACFGSGTIENCTNRSDYYVSEEDCDKVSIQYSGILGSAHVYKNKTLNVKGCNNLSRLSLSKTNAAAGIIFSGNGAGTVVEGCHNSGDLKADSAYGITYSGGSSVRGCTNSGDLSGEKDAAGIAHDCPGVIENCSNSGTISGNREAAGIVTELGPGTVSKCSNSGTIITGDSYTRAGGIAANATGAEITDCYNRGEIKTDGTATETAWLGGVLGQYNKDYADYQENGKTCQIKRCYNTGKISSSGPYTGAIWGDILTSVLDTSTPVYTIENSYYLKGSAASGTGSKGTATGVTELTNAKMKDQTSYENWDFDQVWQMGDGEGYEYPVLVGGSSFDDSGNIKSVVINERNPEITVGKTQKLSYTLTPSDALVNKVEWKSSNKNVADVNSSSGEVTGVAAGTAYITVTVDGKSDSIEVTVKPASGEITDADSDLKNDDTISEKELTDISKALEESAKENKRLWIKGLQDKYEYNGAPVEPAVDVYFGTTRLRLGRDYSISYSNNKSAPQTGKITVNGKGSYSAKAEQEFSIVDEVSSGTISIKKAIITGIEKSYPYNGSAVMPSEPTVTLGNKTLNKGTDYSICFSKNTDVGTATLYIAGIGDYKDYIKKTFKITAVNVASAKNLGTLKIKAENAVYSPRGAVPTVTVTFSPQDGKEWTLREGVDYKLSFSGNTTVGSKGTVTVKGQGNFTNKTTETFDVGPGDLSELTMSVTDLKYKANQNKVSAYQAKVKIIGKNGKSLEAQKDYVLKYYDVNAGVVLDTNITKEDLKKVQAGDLIEVTASEGSKKNYVGTLVGTYQLRDEKNINSAKAVVDVQVYDGTKKTPRITLTWGKNKTPLKEGTDYEIVSYNNNVNKGTAAMIVRGLGEYSGTKSIKFSIKALNVKDSYLGAWNGTEFMK